MYEKAPVLKIRNLNKKFRDYEEDFYAVCDFNLDLYPGECVAVIGETGCGKSTLARMVMNVIPATSGEIWFKGKELTKGSRKEWRDCYRKMQLISQNPHSTFQPRMKIGRAIAEPLIQFGVIKRKDALSEAERLLKIVDLPSELMDRYPHQLSGGQLQRASIARALALRPNVLICDEVTSALDVSIQQQIGNILVRLMKEYGMSYIFIGHDLAFVKKLSHRICIMYMGHVVEIIPSEKLVEKGAHPYTKELLHSVFPVHGTVEDEISLQQIELSNNRGYEGCPYFMRCTGSIDICKKKYPEMYELEKGHWCACFKYQQILKDREG